MMRRPHWSLKSAIMFVAILAILLGVAIRLRPMDSQEAVPLAREYVRRAMPGKAIGEYSALSSAAGLGSWRRWLVEFYNEMSKDAFTIVVDADGTCRIPGPGDYD